MFDKNKSYIDLFSNFNFENPTKADFEAVRQNLRNLGYRDDIIELNLKSSEFWDSFLKQTKGYRNTQKAGAVYIEPESVKPPVFKETKDLAFTLPMALNSTKLEPVLLVQKPIYSKFWTNRLNLYSSKIEDQDGNGVIDFDDVKVFQRSKGLVDDGKIGRRTLDALGINLGGTKLSGNLVVRELQTSATHVLNPLIQQAQTQQSLTQRPLTKQVLKSQLKPVVKLLTLKILVAPIVRDWSNYESTFLDNARKNDFEVLKRNDGSHIVVTKNPNGGRYETYNNGRWISYGVNGKRNGSGHVKAVSVYSNNKFNNSSMIRLMDRINKLLSNTNYRQEIIKLPDGSSYIRRFIPSDNNFEQKIFNNGVIQTRRGRDIERKHLFNYFNKILNER